MTHAIVSFASGESSLSVRRFMVREEANAPFTITVWACSPYYSLPLADLVGKPAGLELSTGYPFSLNGQQRWSGICRHMEQVRPDASGLSTYRLQIVPPLWLLTQRTNYRVFQHLSLPEIVAKIVREWGLDASWAIDDSAYPKLNYKVQYAETDYAFISRLLEEAGIAYVFAGTDSGSLLTFNDALQSQPLRAAPPLPFMDNPSPPFMHEYVTGMGLSHDVRPGAHALRDYDMRRPAFDLTGPAPTMPSPEDRYEQYQYRPGGSLAETGSGGQTPAADDHGAARHDLDYAKFKAERTLAAMREGRERLEFYTNAIDLRPGSVFTVNHPHPELRAKLLVTELSLEGRHDGEWVMQGRAVLADKPYRPAIVTPRPRVRGVQSATVVGPGGEEIHTDEFGRVRVQFPWDRYGHGNHHAGCWIRVNQGWSGAGFGMVQLPRVGQEVLVSFLDGDPDQPVVVGRLYNATQPVPHKLNANKTISTYKSDTSIGHGGFNELQLEDKAGDELYYLQAEKNLRKLVKNDETITVGHDRAKLVTVDETDTTGVNRVEVTGKNRTQNIGSNSRTVIGGNRNKRVKGDEQNRVERIKRLLGGKDQHLVVAGNKHEQDEIEVHELVVGDRKQKIVGNQSLTLLEDQHEKVAGSHALQAGADISLQANVAITGEAGSGVTIKGPGGFIRIDALGVTIKGTMVDINVGGSAGKGLAAAPEAPLPPAVIISQDLEAEVIELLFKSGVKVAHSKSPVPEPHWKKGEDVSDGRGSKRPAVYLIESKGGSHELTVKINIKRVEGISGEGKLIGTLGDLEFSGKCPLSVGEHEVDVTITELPDTIEWYRGDVQWAIEVASAGTAYDVDNLTRLEVFVTFDQPAPFFTKGVWAEALRFLFDQASVGGAARPSEAMSRLTNYCHGSHGLSYDTARGAPRYGCGPMGGVFNLDGYINVTSLTVNCYDQAGAVQTFGGALGITTAWDFQCMPPKVFGFINETDLIGVGRCNNPFFDSNGSAAVVAATAPERTAFGNHAFIEQASSIFDACAGPHTGTEDAAAYLTASVDSAETSRRGYAPGTAADIVVGGGVTDVR